jgi:hypothetical protein
MKNENLADTAALIVKDFGLEAQEEPFSEEALLQLLANRIAEMIEYELEVLLSNMYRLDVNEKKVNFALSPQCSEPANIALARLVLDRQKQRVFTKQYYKQEHLDNLDGLEY